MQRVLLAGLLCAAVACGACTSPDADAELKALLDGAELAAESRNTSFFRDLISESYTDRRGRNRDQLLDMVRGYFFVNARIEVARRTSEIEVGAGGRARVVLQAAVLGRPQGGSVLATDADFYRLELELAREDSHWRVIGADWIRVL